MSVHAEIKKEYVRSPLVAGKGELKAYCENVRIQKSDNAHLVEILAVQGINVAGGDHSRVL